MFVPIRTHTQNFEESASIGTSHTAEQYSYEFKVSDQKGRRLRSSSRISRTNRAGAIMAVESKDSNPWGRLSQKTQTLGSAESKDSMPWGRLCQKDSNPWGRLSQKTQTLRYGCGCFKVSRRESYSSEFKVSDQEGRRMRSNSRISRSSRTGAIVAVVSTEVPIDSVVI